MTTLVSLIQEGASIDAIAQHVDGLEEAQRIEQMYACGAKPQAKLWEAAAGRDIKTTDFVNESDKTVIYAGRNTLPVFNYFQKRFWRPSDGSEVVGYNHQSMSKFTGPGYFVTEDGDNGELVFNYVKSVSLCPPAWPEIRPNTGLIPSAVYGHMLDYNRRVTKDMVIGCATKKGKAIGQYYLLTRARNLE